ncbi:TauD/TfdA family dioxygenase [Streptomyces sp. 900105755]
MAHRDLTVTGETAGCSAVFTESLEEFLTAARRHPQGLVVLRADAPVQPDELRRYCLALGGVMEYEQAGEIRVVRNDPSIPNSTAMSDRPLPLHTDGTFAARPPERFLLSFTRADNGGGGLSTFMPVSEILATAPGPVIEALLTADYLFPRGYDGDLTDSYIGPVLFPDGAGLGIRWRSDTIWRPQVIDHHGTKAADAIDWLHDYLTATEPYTYAAREGETLLVPNTVLLHGRTALSTDSPRELLRVWVTDHRGPGVR